MGELEHAKNTGQVENLYWCSGEATCVKAPLAWLKKEERFYEEQVLQPGHMGERDREWGHYNQVGFICHSHSSTFLGKMN
jgi:hypothetical protein